MIFLETAQVCLFYYAVSNFWRNDHFEIIIWSHFSLRWFWKFFSEFTLTNKVVFFAPPIIAAGSGFPSLLSVLKLAMADNGISSSVSLFSLSSMDILGNMLTSSSLSSKDNSDKSETFPSATKSIAS